MGCHPAEASAPPCFAATECDVVMFTFSQFSLQLSVSSDSSLLGVFFGMHSWILHWTVHKPTNTLFINTYWRKWA